MTTESDPLVAFRAELKHCREELGLTYEEAGRRAGISGQRWRNIEIGYELKSGNRIPANPRRSNLIKMARAVEIPVQHALQLAGLEALKPIEERRVSQQPRRDLKLLIDSMPEDTVVALLGFLATMRDPNAGPDPATKAVEGEIPPPRDALEPIDEDEGNGISLD